jgi:cell wall-associated NlpC family hydrolase
VAALLAGLITITGLGAPAGADPTEPFDAGGPSQEEIDRARADEAIAAASVEEVEKMLTDLRSRTEEAEKKSGLAAEEYNKTAVDLAEAEKKVEAALKSANEANAAHVEAKGALARVAVSAAESGAGFAHLEPFLTADGLEDAMRKAELIEIAGTTSERAANRHAVAEQAATSSQERAAQAVEQREAKKSEAELAAANAERSALAAQRAETEGEAERTRLIAVLAEKRNTTVALEREAEAARIRAENEAARRAAEERQRRQEAELAAQRRLEEQERLRREASQANETGGEPNGGDPSDENSSDGEQTSDEGDQISEEEPDYQAPPPPPIDGITSDEGALAALAWARQQIGKPYQWGGSGPASFDCSGLTSQAYANGAGIGIPRVAAAQYARAIKIAYEDMRPGDLIFWGSSAESIYHVALYSGNGNMVEAPRPGKNVQEIPIRWSGVYEYAGRY